MIALPALWVGLLYDREARLAAFELTRHWTFPQLLDFQGQVCRTALRARGPDGATALELARELLRIARAGLKRWNPADTSNLDALDDIVDSGRTLAERVIDAYRASGYDPASVVKLWQIA